VGLTFVKQKIVENNELRKELSARFVESQKYSQIDPWAERATGGVETNEFIPLKTITG